MPLNELQHILDCDHWRHRNGFEFGQHFLSVPQGAKRDLTEDERVEHHRVVRKQSRHYLIALVQVIDPNGSVDNNHSAACGRRRGIYSSPGWVPPILARRRAACRWTYASSPILTSVEVSLIPEYSRAFSSNSSSIVTVVRMGASCIK